MKNTIVERSGMMISKICLAILTGLLVALDIGAYWIAAWFLSVSHGLNGMRDGICLLVSIYGCSIPAWIAVVSLWKLLRSISRGEIFSNATVRALHTTALCCFAVFAITALSAIYYLPMLLLALVACFIGGIVSVVGIAFRNALQMRDELDFTV